MSAKETKACANLARCAALPRYHRVPLSKRKRPRKRPVRKVRAPMPADPGTSDRVECEPTTLRAYPPRKGRKAREGQEPRWACSEHPVGAVLLPSAGSSLLIHLADRLSSREYGPLPPVVRSSGFIQLSYSTKLETRTARRQHGAPPPVLKSDWRRCGRLVAPYPFTTTDTHTRVVRVSRKSEAVRLGRWWDPRKRPVRSVGAQ